MFFPLDQVSTVLFELINARVFLHYQFNFVFNHLISVIRQLKVPTVICSHFICFCCYLQRNEFLTLRKAKKFSFLHRFPLDLPLLLLFSAEGQHLRVFKIELVANIQHLSIEVYLFKEKNLQKRIGDYNRVTHSYTAQYSITTAGTMLPQVFLCMHKPKGCLVLVFKKELKSLLPDSWGGQNDVGRIKGIFTNMDGICSAAVEVIPPHCTPICQPCDVYFFSEVLVPSCQRYVSMNNTEMWLAIFFFVCIFGLLLILDAKKPKNFPPGPKWYPVVGCAYSVAKLRQDMGGYLYKATSELARQYGPVVGLKVGKDRQVVCCDYPTIKEMLTMDDFDGRPQGIFYETRTWGIRRGLLLTDEEFWVEQRRFVLRYLREFGFGRRTMAELVETEAEYLVSVFKKKVNESNGGAIIEIADAFGVYVLNTLWMMMASVRYDHEDKSLKELQKLLTELFANIDMIGTLFSQFPVLRHIAPETSGYKQFIDIHQKVWAFLNSELENHKATFRKGEPRDLMDVYLEMLESKDRKPSFSESQLLAICMDMFMAGSETTSKSLGFGFLYMLLTPEVQAKARREIDSVVGRDRLPTLQDRPNLPYIEAITYESVRVFMGRTFSIPHRALKDTVLRGYNIPKDTMIIANFNGTLMDKDLWGDPENFRPDRFLDENGKIVVPDYYLPFGYGKHKCLGQTLARSNIFIFTAALLQNFEFQVPPGQKPPNTNGIDGATPSPGPFYALVTARS